MSSSDDLVRWSRFVPLTMQGHGTLHPADGDMYFFLAQSNPVHARSLVALFPLVQHARGCIGIALSLNGQEWSSVTPLMSCPVHGVRAEHQPVGVALVPRHSQGGLSRQTQGGVNGSAWDVAIFVHEHVPGISFDKNTPHKLASMLSRFERRLGPGSHIARYAIPCGAFARWTAERLAELEASSESGPPGDKASDSFVCSPAPASSRRWCPVQHDPNDL